MKTYNLLVMAFFAMFAALGVAIAAPATKLIPAPQVNFEVPVQVTKLTELANNVNLPYDAVRPRWPTYASMKEEIKAKAKYDSVLHIINESGRPLLMVVNGKPVYRKDKEGNITDNLFVLSHPSQAPISVGWFERFGDPLVIGMFELEPDNTIYRGDVYVVRFADLIDPDGNLRVQRMGTQGGTPLAQIRPYYIKPRYNNRNMAPLLAMKPGAGKVVIPPPPPIAPAEPAVLMEPFLVADTWDWAVFSKLTDDDGKIVGIVVDSVREGTPYAEAGLEPCSIITGVKILKPDNPILAAKSGWKEGDMFLRITDHLDDEPRIVMISAERLRKALTKPVDDVQPALTEPLIAAVEQFPWAQFSRFGGEDGTVAGLVVEDVAESNPFANAGLKPCMVISGIKILEPEDTLSAAHSVWGRGDLLLWVSDDSSESPRVIRIPEESLHWGLPPKQAIETIAAAATSPEQ